MRSVLLPVASPKILIRETEIPVQLVDLQFVDFQADKEEAARRLLEAITNSADSQKVSFKPFRNRQSRKRLAIFAMLGAFGVMLLINLYTSLTYKTVQPLENFNSPTTSPEEKVSPALTPEQKVTKTAWPKELGVYIADSSEKMPAFAGALSGYKTEDGKDFWGNKFDASGSIRVFQGNGWDGIPEFPNTQNGCSAGMFMLRWRSANPEVVIGSTLGYSAKYANEGRVLVPPKVGSFGYMVGDNCEQPLFKFSSTRNGNESGLVDIYYELKFWQAAP